jgi:hypothetical protein
MQTGDPGQEAIAAMADLGGFNGGVPTALLLIESAHQEIDPAVGFLIGMRLGVGTGGALALVDITLRHGFTLPDSRRGPCHPTKTWNLLLDAS